MISPPDFPSAEVVSGLLSTMLAHPQFHSVVAELDGRVVGSNFLDGRSSIYGVGPITVDPTVQNSQHRRASDAGVPRSTSRGAQSNAAGVRLLQAGFHNRSLQLFIPSSASARPRDGVDPAGRSATRAEKFTGYEVRPAAPADVPACNRVCHRVHGFDREESSCAMRSSRRPPRSSSILAVSPATRPASPSSPTSVAETVPGLMALIGAAPQFGGPGFLLPTRNHEVFTWCLNSGLKLVYQMTLMTIGLYSEPTGPYLPSILY